MPLTCTLIEEAEQELVRHHQRVNFPEELKGNHGHSNPVKKLNPVVSDGLLRVGDRLDEASLPYSTKHPLIIYGKARLAQLMLQDLHVGMGHMCRDSMLTAVCQKYWVTGASAVIKKLVHQCVFCRKYHATAAQQ